jgi:purine-cytosine permease-like protein
MLWFAGIAVIIFKDRNRAHNGLTFALTIFFVTLSLQFGIDAILQLQYITVPFLIIRVLVVFSLIYLTVQLSKEE